MRYAAIDTGVSRNATVLVSGYDLATPAHPKDRPLWVIDRLWRWQGSTEHPLDIRGVVGIEVGQHLKPLGVRLLATDGYELPGLMHALKGTGIGLRVQGGELGPSADGSSIGVYGHGRQVIHEHRLILDLDDAEEVDRLVIGLCAVQMEEGKVYLPSDGDDHHDSASAALRLLWHAGAGDSPKKALDRSKKFGSYQADGWIGVAQPSEPRQRGGWEPTFE